MNETLERLAKIHYGKSPNDVLSLDEKIPIVGTGGIYGWANQSMFEHGIIVARKGSLGSVHLFKTPFWAVDTTYAIIPISNVNIDWLYYCLLNFDLTKLNEATGVPSINRNWLARTSIENPGIAKQRKIASILNTIDTLINRTQAMVKKYQKIKTGLMQDLFTRGVLHNGKLRPPQSKAPELYQETSIGHIPREWKIESIGSFLTDIQTGNSPNCREIPATSGEWGVLKVSAVHPEGFRDSQNKMIEHSWMIEPSFEVHAGDLLITRANTPELVGLTCLVENPQPKLMLCDKILRLIVNEKKFSKNFMFISFQQHHVRSQIQNAATGTSMSMKNISQSAIRGIKIACPPQDEQLRIAALVQSASTRVRAEKAICKRLRSQKLGLMQDLLTGKVPVKVDEPDAGDA